MNKSKITKSLMGFLAVSMAVLLILSLLGCQANDKTAQAHTNPPETAPAGETPNSHKIPETETPPQPETQPAKETGCGGNCEDCGNCEKEIGVQFNIYGNARFGFTLPYPDIFNKSYESDNGDGITLESKDKAYILKIWGANNIDDSTGKSLLEQAKTRVAHITGEETEENFYSLRYQGGGDSQEINFYECGFISEDKIFSYMISYPAEEKDKFEKIINYMTSELKKQKS